ncbi:hypothetical protein M378DRAFT_9653 [Amanita muscaria Koide BX008]|uniref:Uncharacterized protein n=1 Tax=Amanita muscaria (strain Koide BX008) TaxID=946122 RepID=A0A0C2TIZ8_AMAMK|nr:hypothetical protein M378DRAFT_9653 [Amanita muscaria Koide BX008]
MHTSAFRGKVSLLRLPTKATKAHLVPLKAFKAPKMITQKQRIISISIDCTGVPDTLRALIPALPPLQLEVFSTVFMLSSSPLTNRLAQSELAH